MSAALPSKFSLVLALYRRLLRYSIAYWPVALLALLGMLIDAAGLTAFTGMIKPMIDKLFQPENLKLVNWMICAILGIAVIRGLSSYAADFGMAYISLHVVQNMRRDVFESYLHLPNSFFTRESSAHQISRISYTCEQIASASTTAISTLVTDGFTVLGLLAMMLYTSPYLALALLVMLPTLMLVATVIRRRYRRVSKRIQGSMGLVSSSVSEVVSGRREIRVYGGQIKERQRFDMVSRLAARLELKIESTSAVTSAGIQSTAAAALACIIYLATRPGIEMTAGTFMQMLMAMAGLLAPIKRLANVQSSLQKGLTAAEELFDIIDLPRELDQGHRGLARAEGDIRFEGVCLSFDHTGQRALDGVDLVCPRGTVTALVGASGSGKSTLASLLPRFNLPDAGRVRLDGIPLDEFRLADLRKQIAWVGQNVVLFDDTVAANIAYGELAEASEKAILAAAKAANALEFIERLPQGLATPIGESGQLLSGGQRQRIAIARAILKNAPILILDEATSALDTESEWLIQQALKRLMADRTTLVIAHRLSTIESADQIAVLEQGRVIELGRHQQLLDAGGRYARLHQMQFHETAVADD